jgi:hypothetical protein
MSAPSTVVSLIFPLVMLAACCTASNPCIRDVSSEQLQQITRTICHDYPPCAPVKRCFHRPQDPVGTLYLILADGSEFMVWYEHKRWQIRIPVTVIG